MEHGSFWEDDTLPKRTITGRDRIVFLFLISFQCPPQAMHIHSILGMLTFHVNVSFYFVFFVFNCQKHTNLLAGNLVTRSLKMDRSSWLNIHFPLIPGKSQVSFLEMCQTCSRPSCKFWVDHLPEIKSWNSSEGRQIPTNRKQRIWDSELSFGVSERVNGCKPL